MNSAESSISHEHGNKITKYQFNQNVLRTQQYTSYNIHDVDAFYSLVHCILFCNLFPISVNDFNVVLFPDLIPFVNYLCAIKLIIDNYCSAFAKKKKNNLSNLF